MCSLFSHISYFTQKKSLKKIAAHYKNKQLLGSQLFSVEKLLVVINELLLTVIVYVFFLLPSDLSKNTITVLEEGAFQGLSSLDYL